MKRPTSTRLSLDKHVIRELRTRELAEVAGGRLIVSEGSHCCKRPPTTST